MSHDKSIFTQFYHLHNTSVSLPNRVAVNIVGLGSIVLNNMLKLQNVMYIPQFRFHLLIIRALTRGLNCGVWFDSKACEIHDRTREWMIGRGKQINYL